MFTYYNVLWLESHKNALQLINRSFQSSYFCNVLFLAPFGTIMRSNVVRVSKPNTPEPIFSASNYGCQMFSFMLPDRLRCGSGIKNGASVKICLADIKWWQRKSSSFHTIVWWCLCILFYLCLSHLLCKVQAENRKLPLPLIGGPSVQSVKSRVSVETRLNWRNQHFAPSGDFFCDGAAKNKQY